MPKSHAIEKKKLHMNYGLTSKTTGHSVDTGAFDIEGGIYTPWICKLNKHKGKKGRETSILEVAFSEVALLFIKPGLTPPAKIIIEKINDNQEVIGVASKNFNVQIKKQIDSGTPCYSFNGSNWQYTPISNTVNENEIPKEAETLKKRISEHELISDDLLETRIQLEVSKKGVNFLDNMPKNFFPTLMEQYKNGEINVDMESLASILTASYVLEEDDLHKGNVGFFITDSEKEGKIKKTFHFFKIDHDLMFNASIMAQKDMRIANIFYDKNSFKITLKDLDRFPDLADSGNHYWPTKKRMLVAGTKAYTNKEERTAFAELKQDKEFNNAKWKYFLKSALIPIELVEKSLTYHLDPDEDTDKINMVKNSAWNRINQLKQKMLKSDQFKDYLLTQGEDVFKELKIEIEDYINNLEMDPKESNSLISQIKENYNLLVYCAQAEQLPPLQQSILLDNYKFSSTTKRKKPTSDDLNVAIDQFNHSQKNNLPQTFKFACITADLIQKSDQKAQWLGVLDQINQFKMDHLKQNSINTLADFKEAANKIRTSYLPLKQQKNEILTLLKETKLPKEELKQLRAELKKKEPDSPSLKFINQLRSNLWLVRKIFGTYGKTETSSLMIREIDAQIKSQLSVRSQNYKKRYQSEVKSGIPEAESPAPSKGY
jgi:hypothetical protein